MGLCPKCGRSNWKAGGDNSLCWECYSGRTDAYKNGPKMVGAVPQQKPKQYTESPTIRYTANGYFKKKWYRNGDLYSGTMEDGYRHGKGKWTRATDKYTYDGDWYMSKRHGHGHIVGLRSDGTAVACGKDRSGYCDVGSFRNIGIILAGNQCTVLIFNDGTVKVLGKYHAASLYDRGVVGAVYSNFGKIISLDNNGSLHGDIYGVDLTEFTKDFKW